MSTILDTPLSGQRRPRSAERDKLAAQPLLILLGAALAVLLLIGGTRLLLAGIASYQAETFLQDWEKKGQAPGARAWQIAHDAAQRAIALYPGANGDYQQRLGQIIQWQPGQSAAARQAALEAFRAATQSRPYWPEHWLGLAWAKLDLQQFDDEFHRALAEAQQLGPWRIAINRDLAGIGLIAWAQLSTDEQATVLEAARRTARFSTPEATALLRQAEQTGRTSLLCQSLDEALKKQRKICL